MHRSAGEAISTTTRVPRQERQLVVPQQLHPPRGQQQHYPDCSSSAGLHTTTVVETGTGFVHRSGRCHFWPTPDSGFAAGSPRLPRCSLFRPYPGNPLARLRRNQSDAENDLNGVGAVGQALQFDNLSRLMSGFSKVAATGELETVPVPVAGLVPVELELQSLPLLRLLSPCPRFEVSDSTADVVL